MKVPLARKNGALEEASGEEALDLVAARFKEAAPQAFGLLALGKNTNEDVYVLQKFARVVMGTNNVEYCGRLCHSPTAAGLGPTVGGGVMPISQLDLELADCIFLAEVNLKETFPLMTMRVLRAKEKGARVIVLDPRRTATARYLGDIHLQLKPGTDVAVLNAMMRIVLDKGLEDKAFITARTTGIEALRQHLTSLDLGEMAAISGVPLETIREAALAYATAKTGCIVYDQGLNQHTTGTDNVKALASLALLASHYGRPGFLVVQDIFPTETTQLANVVLPAATWVEREGTHTWVDRRVQKIDRVIDPPGEAQPDWWVVAQLAERMGYGDKFDFSSPGEILGDQALHPHIRRDQLRTARQDHRGNPVALSHGGSSGYAHHVRPKVQHPGRPGPLSGGGLQAPGGAARRGVSLRPDHRQEYPPLSHRDDDA